MVGLVHNTELRCEKQISHLLSWCLGAHGSVSTFGCLLWLSLGFPFFPVPLLPESRVLATAQHLLSELHSILLQHLADVAS